MTRNRDVPTPYVYQGVVKPEWLDDNGHMNVAYYMSAFDDGGEVFFVDPGIGWDYTRQGQGTVFVVSSKVDYRRELLAGERFTVTTRLIDFTSKLIHTYYSIYHAADDDLVASAEMLYIHIDLNTRKSAPLPRTARQRLDEILLAHQSLPLPAGLGAGIGIERGGRARS